MTVLTKPSHITSLSTSAILVAIDIKIWSATKQDQGLSDEVTTAKKADRNAGRFTQHLLADNPLHRQINNYRSIVYNWMQKRAYPWSGSHNILPVIDLSKFMKEYQEHEDNFNRLVDNFIVAYPSIVSDMAFKMGDMFNIDNYPSPEQARRKFSMELYTAEVPEGDFRVQVSQELAADLQNNYDKQAGRLIERILEKQIEQFTEIMESLSTTCDVAVKTDITTGETKVRKRKLYDSTFNRALELCDTFKEFNLTNNPKLDEARQGLEDLLRGLAAEDIRKNDAKRVEIKNTVDDILSRFKA